MRSSVLVVLVSSASFAQVATSLSLTSPNNPAYPGTPVTLSATVTGTLDDGGLPTGTVTFSAADGGLGSAPVVAGLSVFTTAFTALGTYTLVADYSGDADFAPSTSPAFSLEVTRAPTTTQLSYFNERLEVEVSSSIGTPDGVVSVVVDGAAPLTATLDAFGRARLGANLALGTHVAKASYQGAVRYAPSESSEVSYLIAPPAEDAGVTEPSVDAGTGEPMKPAGCGCVAFDPSVSLLALAALAFRSRRRSE